MPKKSVRDMSLWERTRHSLSAKTFRAVAVLALVISLAAISFGFYLYSSSVSREYRQNAFSQAETCAYLVEEQNMMPKAEELYALYEKSRDQGLEPDTDVYYAVFSEAEDADFDAYRDALHKLQEGNGAVSLYVAAIDMKTLNFVYLIDSDQTDTYCRPGTIEPLTEKEANIYREGSEPSRIDRMFGYTDRTPYLISRSITYGYLCTSGTVLEDQGDVVYMAFSDLDMDRVVRASRLFLLQYVSVMLFVVVFLGLTLVRYLRKKVVVPINELAEAASGYALAKATGEIGSNHFENLNIKTGDEIENLAWTLKDMEKDLGDYVENLQQVTAEKERINTELNVAQQIQEGMIPHIYPAFPERPEFDIYASMDPAKEVGGDFYDFFLIDDDHLAMVMADVSGKGIPAALFMMASKILINNYANILGPHPAKILEAVNDSVTQNNPAEMFVTVWLGVLQISTGKLTCANAGHEYPAIKRAGGAFELYKDKHGFVIGGMPGMSYHEYEIQLSPGDAIFEYTDGVTEATDPDNRLFGTDRMIESLNLVPGQGPQQAVKQMAISIDGFIRGADQFDDITMLCMYYDGPEGETKMPEATVSREERIPMSEQIVVDATVENLPKVLGFLEERLEQAGCSMKYQTQISIAVEEIFVNIANYAYTPNIGKAQITLGIDEQAKEAEITFVDRGVPYNPLEKEDPDMTLSAEERQIGGLGIYMVKESMDEVLYEYTDRQNILTLKKKFE